LSIPLPVSDPPASSRDNRIAFVLHNMKTTFLKIALFYLLAPEKQCQRAMCAQIASPHLDSTADEKPDEDQQT
jgi:hypothetical protein